MKINIHWLTNHYTYYNDYLFSHISARRAYHLQVYYRALVLESHPWTNEIESPYTFKLMETKPFGFDIRLLQMAFRSKDYFVVGGWDCMTYILVITVLSVRNRSFAIFTDTPRKAGRSVKQFLKGWWLDFIFRKKSKAKLFVTGNIGIQRAEAVLNISADHSINFPFATNNSFFQPLQTLGESDYRHRLFLSVGRIDFAHKGQDVTLRALRLILDRGYSNFSYMVAGQGDDMEKMLSLIKDMGLSNHVEILGWKQVSELPGLFNRAHFTIHSSHEDPFPNSILESLSCGTPVISSNAAGSGLERISPGVNGYLHEDNDFFDLANKIEKALNLSFETYSKMRVAARTKAMEWQVSYNLAVLDEVILNPERS